MPSLFPVVSFGWDVTGRQGWYRANPSPSLQKSAQEREKYSFLVFHTWQWLSDFLNLFILFYFFTGREWLWVDHFARHIEAGGGGGGEEHWSWPVKMFSVKSIVIWRSSCAWGSFRAGSDLSYNGMLNSLSNHFLQLRAFYSQTVKLGSVNQQAWIRGKASILSAAKNNSKRS